MISNAGHWPSAGYVVSAASSDGPWTVRGEWSGESTGDMAGEKHG